MVITVFQTCLNAVYSHSFLVSSRLRLSTSPRASR